MSNSLCSQDALVCTLCVRVREEHGSIDPFPSDSFSEVRFTYTELQSASVQFDDFSFLQVGLNSPQTLETVDL